MMSISWQFFPKYDVIPLHLVDVVNVFKQNFDKINSSVNDHNSDKVLSILANDLKSLGYDVEISKKKDDKISIPVLYGKNGKMEKSFDADAYNDDNKTIIEVEAGRGVANFQFLKDLFEACMMQGISYLVIALRETYRGKKDFEYTKLFFETLYASQRLKLPLCGVLLIGY